jgi:intracellular septation protein
MKDKLMQMFYEILPVFLFFLAFKFYDIYVATTVGIIATITQVVLTRCLTKSWDRKQVITMLIFIIFGSMTLYFHNPIFVKWKPTIVFWIFAIAIIITHFTRKPLMQRMMENALENSAVIPSRVWARINLMWAAFFIIMGAINLYIAYTFSNDAWVNFKFYGISISLIVISIIQALYLVRYMTKETTV